MTIKYVLVKKNQTTYKLYAKLKVNVSYRVQEKTKRTSVSAKQTNNLKPRKWKILERQSLILAQDERWRRASNMQVERS